MELKTLKMIKIFYDAETTGTNPKLHSIHRLSGMIEVDGHIVQEFDFCIKPHPKAKIDLAALKISGVSIDDILEYPEMEIVFKQLKLMLSTYIDVYNPKQKAYLVGYNNRAFDDVFLRVFFELCENNFFGSYFWSDSHDTLVLASLYLEDRRANMPSFKLSRVASELGIVVDEKELHDALYDAKLTRKIYRIVTGIELEI